jgi:hypothetical protein
MDAAYPIPMIARGACILDGLTTHPGRRGSITFATPDCGANLGKLVLANPSALADLYQLRFGDIVDYLDSLGHLLRLESNAYLRQALEISKITSGLPDSVLDGAYEDMHRMFLRDAVMEVAEKGVGIDYLEGWVSHTLHDGRNVSIRAFGARSVHVIAGNLPSTAAATIVRNAITRGDALIKTPSNDPMTAVAIAQTMIDMAPDHPLSRHVAVAYWRGGDDGLEARLYQPRHIEKIIAWGGFASVKHITKYLQPGIDLITLDPKLSASILGKEALESEQSMADVALRLATDIAAFNQEACVNARVIYVECNLDAGGLARLNMLGEMVQKSFAKLPIRITDRSKPSSISAELANEVTALEFSEDNYRVFGKDIRDGIVIVSQIDDAVDFSGRLANRVANLVPVPTIDAAIGYVNADTQTIGVYPESLKTAIRQRLAYHGAQRIVSLGYAAHISLATPQDGIEPLRRMCKWIFEESCDTKSVHPLWNASADRPHASDLGITDPKCPS